ncbi:MAG: excinuclease ABC subunit UvrC [Planctomycetota bacterium]
MNDDGQPKKKKRAPAKRNAKKKPPLPPVTAGPPSRIDLAAPVVPVPVAPGADDAAFDTDQELAADLRAKLQALPKAPGVYMFRDSKRKVIYVGKATSLRSRVRSYFSQRDDGRDLYPFMRAQIVDLDTVVTDTEQEALVLENNLIKKFRPRYNIRLRDDKTFISIKVSTKDKWPRTFVVRRYRKDGNAYFGPYSSAWAIRRTLDALRPVFPLRLCNDHTLNNRTRPCIYHDIGCCCAPCVPGKVSDEEYRQHVNGLITFLKGRNDGVVDDLRTRMQAAADRLDFERAAELRDRVAILESIVETQKTQTGDFADRDVIGCYRAGEDLQVHVLFYREGALINSASHQFRNPLPDGELLRQFVVQYYAGSQRYIPREILASLDLDDADGLSQFLSKRAGHAVEIRTPVRGALKELTDLADTNARYAHKDLLTLEQHEERLLTALQQTLGLKNLPDRIECFDISTLQGTHTVASQITFLHGRPEKSQYRRYRVSPENAGNDFDAMAEVLARRVRRARQENDPMPDLLVLDGGPPQLAKVVEVFEAHGVIECDLVALAKSRRLGRGANAPRSPERVYRPGEELAVPLAPDAPETFLMQRVRDEAHRFAITYHRHRRRQEAMQTGLEAVPGLGPRRRHLLLAEFGTSGAIRKASVDDLAKVDGISRKLAEAVFAHFAAQRSSDPVDDDAANDEMPVVEPEEPDAPPGEPRVSAE